MRTVSCIYYSRTETTEWEHYPVSTETETTEWEHYPESTEVETTEWEHYPVSTGTETTEWEHYPVFTGVKTTEWKHYWTLSCIYSTRTETTELEHYLCNNDTEIGFFCRWHSELIFHVCTGNIGMMYRYQEWENVSRPANTNNVFFYGDSDIHRLQQLKLLMYSTLFKGANTPYLAKTIAPHWRRGTTIPIVITSDYQCP